MRHFGLFCLLFILFNTSVAQQDSSNTNINFSGYVDAFYAYDFNQPLEVRQPFLFHYNRHNGANLNLALIRLDIENVKYHGRLALHAGTYPQDNYAAEPIMYRAINEAYVGFAANKKGNLWIDAGIFGSHLGFESAIGVENPVLSRSLSAESSPYFLSGAKMTHEPSEKWAYSLILSNGWQRIQRVPGNSMPSGGTQLTYQPSDKVLINWSTFITTEDPDTARRMMYFNDFYVVLNWHQKWQTILGIDYGLIQQSKGSQAMNNWYNASFITQYQINNNWSSALRVEYFKDDQNVIINTGSGNGFEALGLSLNIDRKIHQKVTWRTEFRTFISPEPNFEIRSNTISGNTVVFSQQNMTLLTSLAIKI